MPQLFEFLDYRAWIQHQIEINATTRGYQNLLARAAGCQRSYLSRAIHSQVELTPEHAAGLARHWSFNADQTEYFVGLVNLSRAGTAELRTLIERRLRELAERNLTVTRQIPRSVSLSDESSQLPYYSAWYMAAVHMALTIPELRTESAIARKLRLPTPIIHRALEELEHLGLAQRTGYQWEATKSNLHLSAGSTVDRLSQSAWRQFIGTRLQEGDSEGLHYSGVHTLSRSDLSRLRTLWLECLRNSRELIAPSPEQELVCLAFDLFAI